VDEHVEHQPAVQAQPCTRAVAALAYAGGESLQARGRVFKAARFVQKLAGVDDMAPLGISVLVREPVKALDEVHGLRHVLAVDGRCP